MTGARPRLRVGAPGRRLRVTAAAIGMAAVAAGCMPQGVTEQSKSVNTLYDIFFGAAVVVFVIVAGLVSWSIIRYRHRGPGPASDAPLPPQYHGNLVLEAIWTTLPILTVLGLFGATMVSLGVIQAAAPSDAVQVHVTAFQWQWRFDYTGQNVTVLGTADQDPVLVVPVGRTVHVTLTSADVNHAFWVPAFLFKQDAIAGHPNQFSFKVDQAGTYRGQCAEFCGIYHDRMVFSVKAVSEAEFSTWLHQQQAAASASSGTSAAPSGAVPASPTAAQSSATAAP